MGGGGGGGGNAVRLFDYGYIYNFDQKSSQFQELVTCMTENSFFVS